MKKYIGLTMYFVGVVGISYTFFYLSGNNGIKHKINIKKQTLDKSNTDNKIINDINISTEESGQIKDKSNTDNKIINDINISTEESGQIKDNIKDNVNNGKITQNLLQEITGDKQQLTGGNMKNKNNIQNTELDNINIGLAHLKSIKDSRYEDIYSIFGLSELPLYKIDNKKIYIKELKSIDYQSEKNNISKLIKKIGGNFVETDLFGDNQLFINIDGYYKKQSIILVSYNGKTYLVVMTYKQYQDYKSYLKNVLFVN